MDSLTVLNQGVVEQHVSFLRYEQPHFDQLVVGCHDLFNNITLSEFALPLYRVEIDPSGFRNKVILNRNVLPVDLDVDDITRHGRVLLTQPQRLAGAVLTIASQY